MPNPRVLPCEQAPPRRHHIRLGPHPHQGRGGTGGSGVRPLTRITGRAAKPETVAPALVAWLCHDCRSGGDSRLASPNTAGNCF